MSTAKFDHETRARATRMCDDCSTEGCEASDHANGGGRGRLAWTSSGPAASQRCGPSIRFVAFTEELRDAWITGSIGSVGDAVDSALMESTIGLFKTGVIGHECTSWAGWRQVEQATASWEYWHNAERLHSSIKDLPPVECEQMYYDQKLVVSESAAASQTLRQARPIRSNSALFLELGAIASCKEAESGKQVRVGRIGQGSRRRQALLRVLRRVGKRASLSPSHRETAEPIYCRRPRVRYRPSTGARTNS